MLSVHLEFFEILSAVSVGILVLTVQKVVSHIVGLPKLVATDNPVVKYLTQSLIPVILSELSRLGYLFAGQRLVNEQIDSTLPLLDSADDAVGILVLLLDIFLLLRNEKFTRLAYVAGLVFI